MRAVGILGAKEDIDSETVKGVFIMVTGQLIYTMTCFLIVKPMFDYQIFHSLWVGFLVGIRYV